MVAIDRTKLLEAMFGSFFMNEHLQKLPQFSLIYPELLQAVKEEVYTREQYTWEFIVDPLTRFMDDFVCVQFGYVEVYSQLAWYRAMTQKQDHYREGMGGFQMD